MIKGHGDDLYKYEGIVSNFSSNVYNFVDHSALYRHLQGALERIRSYPEPEPYSLERQIARLHGLQGDRVCVTNGATEAIYLIAQTFAGSCSAIFAPTFSEYEDACRLNGHRVEHFFSLQEIPAGAQLVWLCNPNNPTGEIRPKELLEAVMDQHPDKIFIVDQSYEMFSERPVLDLRAMSARSRVILLHSLTKCFAVPGIRLGYFTACEALVERIRRFRMPWSVNALAIAAGSFLMEHAQDYRPDTAALIAERRRVEEALLATGAVEITPSHTHYMLVRLKRGKAPDLKEFLAQQCGILIRDASNFAGLDSRYFRIAIQTPAENDELIKGFETWISKR